MNPAAFQNIKLKKVTQDTQNTACTNILGSERELNRRLLQADMDSWYDALAGYTYETVFLPLTVEEAEAMIASYQAHGMDCDSLWLT